jgi:hypothetical protein
VWGGAGDAAAPQPEPLPAARTADPLPPAAPHSQRASTDTASPESFAADTGFPLSPAVGWTVLPATPAGTGAGVADTGAVPHTLQSRVGAAPVSGGADTIPAARADTTLPARLPLSYPAADRASAVPPERLPGAAVSSLGIRVRGRSELGGAWDRFRPCDGLASQRCDGSAMPRLAPDLQLGVVAGGTLLERLQVAVDYDGRREFDAANDIRVTYEGRPGELLSRLDAGNVKLELPGSRFLSQAVPAGHWGFRAVSHAGPVELQALWAQGGGQMVTREFRLPAGGGGALQDAIAVRDDADYAGGQFFFLFDPALLRGAPHLDVLTLTQADGPPALRPAAGISLFRYEGGPPAQDGSTTQSRAVPAEPGAAAEAVSAPFRLLQDGVDYQLHRSGLWLALKQPLRDEEVLGVAYRTADGAHVGDPATASGAARAEIRLLRGARVAHRPGASTWPFEMRHVYRVTGADDVEPGSLRLVISRGESVGGDIGRPHPATGAVIPYLQLFGMDDDLPREQLDAARIYRPASETLEPVVTGVFVVFPTLQPFAAPPPVRSLGFTAAQAADVLGAAAANSAVYAAADSRDRAAAARFRLQFRFASRGSGITAGIALGAFGIREGSERVYAGGRQLQRGTDYEIDYDLGQLELLAPAAMVGFGDAGLRVTFEQLPLFAAAPTRVAGLTARIPLGTRGELHLIGVSQQERSLLRRATLGAEPSSLLLGGATAQFRWGLPWLDRLFEEPGTRSEERGTRNESRGAEEQRSEDTAELIAATEFDTKVAEAGSTRHPQSAIRNPDISHSEFLGPHSEGHRVAADSSAPPLLRSSAGVVEHGGGVAAATGRRSEVRLGGELALSVPDGGERMVAYLDDFEDRGEIAIPLQRPAWRLGSAPVSRERAADVLPAEFAVRGAGELVWQHEYLTPGNQRAGSLRLSEIDHRIRVAGNALERNVLYLTMGAETRPAWRSITSVLSPGGRDLRNYEYLEVYVRGAAPGDALVLDLGTVSEDAFAFDADGRTGGIDEHGRLWGQGVLDQEWDPARESWTATHDVGLWNTHCRAEPGAVYPLGDPRANCTRGDGLADTEDLNGNGILDTDERVFRYVLRPAAAGAPYLAADTSETGTGFRLFRIPLERGAAVGTLPDEIRQVRHLRLTLVAGAGSQLALARMRLVGSRWEKRGATGVVDGLVGERRPGSPLARLEAAPVSRLDAGAAYVSPPGVRDAPQDPASSLRTPSGMEFNEQSLSLRYRGVGGDERAEVYRRYEAGPQNFLAYRQLRLWALARDGAWGEAGEELVVRIGNDAENHYLYRTRLPRVGAPRAPQDWGDEVVIEFDRWIRLRAEAEYRLAEASPAAHEPMVVWDTDSTYAVVIAERGRAPNLAAVREISIGVWNAGPMPVDGELWINELRLGAPHSRPGLAGSLTLGVRAADILDAQLSLMRRSGHFRELQSAPTYLGEDALALNASVQLGRLLPEHWGLDAPLSLSLERAGTAPHFVDGTDLPAAALDELRQLGRSQTRLQLQLRRRESSERPWMRATLDGLAFHFGLTRLEDDSPFAAVRRADVNAGLRYQVRPTPRSLQLLPGGLTSLAWLPFPLGAAHAGHAEGLRLRWTPVHLGFGTTWSDGTGRHQLFSGLLAGPEPALPAHSIAQRTLLNHASLSVQPLESLSGSLEVRSTSDLLPSATLNPTAALQLDAERLRLGGLDLGREARRDLSTQLAWAPRLTAWLTMRGTLNTTFALDANPAYFGPIEVVGDPAALPLRTFGNRRVLGVRWGLDAAALARAVGIADTLQASGWEQTASQLARAVRRLELGWGNTLESRYDRAAAQPDLGYQFALGGRSAFAGLSAEGPTLLADRDHWTARAQLELPGSVGLTFSFSDGSGWRAGKRGERFDRQREWPGLLAQWSGAPFPDRIGRAVRQVSFAAGYGLQSRRWEDRGSDQLRTSRTLRVPLDLALQWVEGFSTSYRGELRFGGSDSPSASTESVSADHSVTVGGAFATPEPLLPLFPAPISVSLRYTRAAQRECRISFELSACAPGHEFSGHRNRILGMQLDTRATSGMNFGLVLEHRDRSTRAYELSGHRQFSLSLFGQFDFDVRSAGRD